MVGGVRLSTVVVIASGVAAAVIVIVVVVASAVEVEMLAGGVVCVQICQRTCIVGTH